MQYSELMDITGKDRVVIKLLDIVLGKGENVCREFLDLLKEDNVNEISPELRDWIKTVDTTGKISASGGSRVYAPTIIGASLDPTVALSGKSDVWQNCKISASGGSSVYAPTITGAVLGTIEINMTAANAPGNHQKADKDQANTRLSEASKIKEKPPVSKSKEH
ncbi:hypothetical protein QQF64_032885 [Cirrhinus molitorella]|uniref:CARD domain-containing protein n=1 Tax=Cirrhinus molitorella TaxID=172907 RepID=A0ABR3MSA8_9TELE